MSASEPSPGGEIKGQNVSERREQFTPGSEEGKAAVSMYWCGALILLPPSAQGRQDPTPSPCFTYLKFLPLGSALPSSGASVLMPTPSSTLHSCSQPLPPASLHGKSVFRISPEKGPLVGVREASRVQGGAEQSRGKANFTTSSILFYSPPPLIQPSANGSRLYTHTVNTSQVHPLRLIPAPHPAPGQHHHSPALKQPS